MNIGFDADGVLFNTELFQLSEEVKSFMKQQYGLNVVNPDGYGIKDVFGCSTKVEMEFWTKFVIKYSLFFKARPWTKETIDMLRREGNKIFIITSKACSLEKNYKGICVRFLFELGLKLNGIHVDGIEYCSLENSAASKLEACQKLGIKVLVEDKLDNITYLSNYIHVICMESRNNNGLSLKNVQVAKDVNDVYANLKRLIAKYNQQPNIFSMCELKSKEEKMNMNVAERTQYYSLLLEYYKSLPFNHDKMLKSEKIIRIITTIYKKYFDYKYNPIVIGKENLPKTKGNIYICNHLCSKDLIFLYCELNTELEQWHPLIKQEILNEMVGIIFKLGNSVFVERTNPKSRHLSTQELAKDVANGYNVLIFPEGTYNRTEALLKEFTGSSHVYLSQILQRPIIPMALTNDYTKSPILRIDRPYVVDRNISLSEAQQQSYKRLEELVASNNQLLLKMRKL